MTNNFFDIDLVQKRKIIYRFFAKIVRKYPAADVLKEFQGVFFDYYSHIDHEEAINAIYDIIFSRHEESFISIIKHVSYILIDYWLKQKEYGYINELVRSFIRSNKKNESYNTMMNLRNTWLENFVKSQDYQDMQLFIYQDKIGEKNHWKQKYQYYLLVNQYSNNNNLKLQREAARILAAKLKTDFKFNLARYIAYTQSDLKQESIPYNPTHLGQQVIYLIKTIIARKAKVNYANLAKVFIEQIEEIEYYKFKNSLHTYIMFSLHRNETLELLRQKSYLFIYSLYPGYNNIKINNNLFFNTCNVLLEQLTIINTEQLGELFKIAADQLNPLTLAIILLKIVLISPNSRIHLENNLGHLIKVYQNKSIQECQWFITFLDIFNISFSIYVDPDIKYNLVKRDNGARSLENYEIVCHYPI